MGTNVEIVNIWVRLNADSTKVMLPTDPSEFNTFSKVSGGPNLPLRNLCVLCASAVHLIFRHINRKGAEDAEITQRKTSN